jgi:hypothetical protein
MSWKVEVLSDEEAKRGSALYVHCQHKIPRVLSTATLQKFPYMKSCMRGATVRINGELRCTMHGGQMLLQECIDKNKGEFYTTVDIYSARDHGINEGMRRAKDQGTTPIGGYE